jgi:EAL domain-containing protein (putative c-di-GMP-specific phosphodiesterase class I)
VAEFVDSAAVLEKITEMGVDYAQGYHLHRPEPIQNVLNMVGGQARIRPVLTHKPFGY